MASMGEVEDAKEWLDRFYAGDALIIETLCGAPEPFMPAEGEHNYANLAEFLKNNGVSSLEIMGSLGFKLGGQRVVRTCGGCLFVAAEHLAGYIPINYRIDLVFPGLQHTVLMDC